MNSVYLRYLLLEKEKQSIERMQRRQIRDESDPLALPDTKFQLYYRLNKDAFLFVLRILQENLPSCGKLFAVPAIVKLASTLRFFAEGSYQKGVGEQNDVGLAQSTFSEVFTEVLDIFERVLCPQWIVWPSLEEKKNISSSFYTKYHIPGVVGCIDGTHVRIIAPSKNRHLFYNRKGFNSLNVTIVVDNNAKIRYVDSSHGGATHDASIWATSSLRASMQQDYLDGHTRFWLLGDAAYPLESWLLVPYRNASEGSVEAKFNEVHSSARNIVQRTNAILKNRWRCLLGARELYYSPEKCAKIVNVCSALHNICVDYKCDTTYEEMPVEEMYEEEYNDSVQDSNLDEAHRIRYSIANLL